MTFKKFYKLANDYDINKQKEVFDSLLLPNYMWNEVENWIMTGKTSDRFLHLLFTEGDIISTVCAADYENSKMITEWVDFATILPAEMRTIARRWPGISVIKTATEEAAWDKLKTPLPNKPSR